MRIDVVPNASKCSAAEAAVTYKPRLLPAQVGHAEADEGHQMLDIGSVRLVTEGHLVAKRTQQRGDDRVLLVYQDRQLFEYMMAGLAVVAPRLPGRR